MGKFFRGAALGFVAAIGLAGGIVPQARAETLTDTLILAYKNSNLLEQNRALLRAADENVAQAIASLRPVLAFIANANYADTPLNTGTTSASIGLSASLNVYDGGANRLAVESAKESVLSTRANLVSLEQRVLLAAVQAYMDVRSASQNVSLQQSSVRLISEQLRAAQDRFEVGEVTRTDVAQAQSFLAAARSSLVAAQGAFQVARESYKAAVGQYPNNLSGVSGLPDLPRTLNDARGIAERTHPDIEAAQRQVTVSLLSMQRARAARGPSIAATARVSRDDSGNNTSNVGLELQQTIYSGGALKSAERQALANRDAAQANLLQSVRIVDQQVANAWANLSVARAQLSASDQQIQAAQLAYDGTKEEARLGSRTTLDVLNAEQDLLDARTGRVQAETDRYVAIYQVLSSMGLLTVDHLKLGIATYDPAAYYNAVKNAPVRSVQGDRLDKVLKSIGRQ
ncbi:MAG: TolC family outer membrane protein [Paracoccaceae bacterium]